MNATRHRAECDQLWAGLRDALAADGSDLTPALYALLCAGTPEQVRALPDVLLESVMGLARMAFEETAAQLAAAG